MNNLFSGSYFRLLNRDQYPPHPAQRADDIEMASTGGVNLDKFFTDVESIKDELSDLETLYAQLQGAHEQSKTLHSAKAAKEIRSKMDNDVTQSLKKAKFIKICLEALDISNAANRGVPGCGPGSSSDRTRTSVVNSLRKKLNDQMNLFNEFRKKMGREYRETVQRRYYKVTGEKPDEEVLDLLVSTGRSETFSQKAIQEQGRDGAMDTIMEIKERHDAGREIEKNLMDLHKVFLDMAVYVESQGEKLNDITRGADQLQHQKNTWIWTYFAISYFIVFIIATTFLFL